ncbi:Tim44-like domain-containing protein [Curvibacter sp. HBC61]|uniref:Tim44-like domain-containing protein n=1 Tax=Curvibacter cyanobacteriorum TaxID=3026422 RepID=A0ABT5MXH7_9BURK|nr:Tim44-like domain-containing protein [Curvibacter sp. HBC61]MDD0837996.1 Tim44-like domain-containing protein [Curvibacter sp. HBC61]
MKKLLSVLAVVLSLGIATVSMEAEAAKRMGGGKSVGTQREAVQNKAPAAPTAQGNPSTAAAAAPAAGAGAAAAASKSSWAGPLAGLAAGLGIAALASHFGFGDELASMLMMGLLAFAVLAVIGFVLRRRAQSAQGTRPSMPGLVPAAVASGAADPGHAQPAASQPSALNSYKVATPASTASVATGSGSLIGSALQPVASAASVPADFDRASFEHHAKANFVRLQAAYDAGVVDELRDFTSPELLAELKQELSERGAATQRGEVMQLQAKVLEVAEESQRYLVSVQFTGFMRYGAGTDDEVFDEVWVLAKPIHGQGGWVLTGIQQMG